MDWTKNDHISGTPEVTLCLGAQIEMDTLWTLRRGLVNTWVEGCSQAGEEERTKGEVSRRGQDGSAGGCCDRGRCRRQG